MHTCVHTYIHTYVEYIHTYTHAYNIRTGREPDATDSQREKGQKAQTDLSALVNNFILRRTNELLSKHLPPKIVQVTLFALQLCVALALSTWWFLACTCVHMCCILIFGPIVYDNFVE